MSFCQGYNIDNGGSVTGYDIALVRMSAPVDLGALVSPARLYSGHDSSLLGFHMHTVGWGWTCPTCSGTSDRLKAVSGVQ